MGALVGLGFGIGQKPDRDPLADVGRIVDLRDDRLSHFSMPL